MVIETWCRVMTMSKNWRRWWWWFLGIEYEFIYHMPYRLLRYSFHHFSPSYYYYTIFFLGLFSVFCGWIKEIEWRWEIFIILWIFWGKWVENRRRKPSETMKVISDHELFHFLMIQTCYFFLNFPKLKALNLNNFGNKEQNCRKKSRIFWISRQNESPNNSLYDSSSTYLS